MKKNSGRRHLLRLLDKEAGADGWAVISDIVYPLFEGMVLDCGELFETERSLDKYRGRLTSEGKLVLKWLEKADKGLI